VFLVTILMKCKFRSTVMDSYSVSLLKRLLNRGFYTLGIVICMAARRCHGLPGLCI
jgi:hypothetical protein